MGILAQIYDFRWLVASSALIYYLVGKIWVYNRLKEFRGPFSTGFSELWHTSAILSFKSHIKYKEVCDKYGSIARVGPTDLITTSPELLTHMSAVRSPYTRAAWYNLATRFQTGKDHVFSQLDEEKHMRRRQQMAPGYSGKENLALEGSIDARISEFIHLIRSKYLSSEAFSKPMDFALKIQYLTLDVISDIGFGKPFGDLTEDADVHDYVKSGETGLLINTTIMALGLTRLMQTPFIANALGPSEKDKAGLGRLIGNARAIITSRLTQDTEKRSDMLASFVRHGLDAEDLVSETCLQVLAGSDTTATALQGIMLYLLSHARVYSKLQAEVDRAVRDGRVPPHPSIISDTEVRKLEYLQAVIKEGIRIHPPVTDVVPKRVPDGGDNVIVDGKPVFLPGGTNVGFAVWALNLSKEVFGEDAEEFRPERWLLEKDEKQLALMNKTHELIFGYGRYQCLGRPIALMEIGKTVFEIMRNFDWCLAKPEAVWTEANYMGIFTHKDLWVLATDRTEVV